MDYRSRMNETLGCRFLAPPKRGRALTTTSPAAPAAFALIYLRVLWRKRMPIAASIWDGERTGLDWLVDATRVEANHFGFGCFKARPRYHSTKSLRVTRLKQWPISDRKAARAASIFAA